MDTIRKIRDEEFYDFTDIVKNEYPEFKIVKDYDIEEFAKECIVIQNSPRNINFYGIYRKNDLIGGMRLHDFKMNFLSTSIHASGLGLIAVRLIKEREKTTRDMIGYFLNHTRNKRVPIALSYPFKPDLYRDMGFGYGTILYQYSVKPEKLITEGPKSHIEFLEDDDIEEFLCFYNRYKEKTNGMIEREADDFKGILKKPLNKIVIYKADKKILGYVLFSFKNNENESSSINDIIIKEFLYETREAFDELMCFFSDQKEHVRNIIFNIPDDNFRFALLDPRDGFDNIISPAYHRCSIQGTGLMYRVTDTQLLFSKLKEHNFNGENITLKISINDKMLNENNKDIIVSFKNGFPTVLNNGDYDAEIGMDISDFSSLITCSVDFKTLYRYNRAYISDMDKINIVNRVFSSDERPICYTLF